jgi:hypothetical protein
MDRQCSGITLKGIRCSLKTSSTYCRYHKYQEIREHDEGVTCCVCTEPINTQLKCGHQIHLNCVIKSGKSLCPVCTKKVPMTGEELRLTEEYYLKYKRETFEENMRNLMHRLRTDPNSVMFPFE